MDTVIGRRSGGGDDGWTRRIRRFTVVVPRPSSVGNRGSECLVHPVPIHHVPPRGDVVRTTVLVLQVIGVLPDIETEHRFLAVHQRIVLVRRAGDRHLTAVGNQPHPAAAETARPSLAPFRLEIVEAAKRRVDRVGGLARRGAAGVGRHPVPEHAVVPVPAAVVANRRANGFGNAVYAPAQIIDALALQLGRLLEGGIEVGDVRLMMLPVMDLHRLRVDMRLERGVVVWELRQFVSHSSSYRRMESYSNRLADRQHALERDAIPVLLLFGDNDSVVYAPLDKLFENPEQVIGRYPEHRRTETPELVERDDGSAGRKLLSEAVDEVNFCADGPDRSFGTAGDRLDDVLGAAAVVSGLHYIPRDLWMHDHTDAGMLAANRFDLLRGETRVDRAMPFPQNHLRALHLFRIEAAKNLVRIPHHHIVERDAHLVRGIPPEMLIRQEQNLVALSEAPLQRGHRIRRRADSAAALADE